MARYTGPKCKLCRREGTKLFLKGSKCMSEKCPVATRNQPPGENTRGPRRLSDYGRQLREKQKVKRIYGILETQFRRYYENAAKVKGVTGLALLQILETRLDNVVYASGAAPSRAAARKLVGQGKVHVNDKVITIPSYQISKDDLVKVNGIETKPKEESDMPEWLNWDAKSKSIKIVRVPLREDMDQEINEQLIVEFYSR